MFAGQFANHNQVIRGTGGTVTDINGYKVHTFNSSSNFIKNKGIGAVEYLIIAGGGGGGINYGGGGGAGGYLSGTQTLQNLSFPIVIGGGGNQSNGANTSFNEITAIGGGRGGNFYAYNSNDAGQPGGSGGGGCTRYPDGASLGGAGQSGQGRSGGNALNWASTRYCSGGGGGAGATGTSAYYNADDLPVTGPGGNGISSSITGTSITRGGGGGGGGLNESTGLFFGANGGTGGGGGISNANGVSNTGGGGRGGGGIGGSGVVILRYVS